LWSAYVYELSRDVNSVCAVKRCACYQDGQLGNGTQVDSSVPVTVVNHSSGVAAIAVGANHSCAVMSSGALQCWGYNQFGQLGNGSTTNATVPGSVSGLSSGVVAVSGGDWHSCALFA